MSKGQRSKAMGMTAGFMINVLTQTSQKNDEEVTWLSKSDGSHPTPAEAVAWLQTLDPNLDVINELEGAD